MQFGLEHARNVSPDHQVGFHSRPDVSHGVIHVQMQLIRNVTGNRHRDHIAD